LIIPFYILGLLQRFGPQHGYQIKKIISEQLSDFTQIKLPVIYYHLEKMASQGFLLPDCEKNSGKIEKTVYSITEKGRKQFFLLFEQLLEFDYRPVFPADGVFYFSENSDSEVIVEKLLGYAEKLTSIIQAIEKHRDETVQFIPAEYRGSAGIIFNHHLLHYRAEREWAETTISVMEKEKEK
jgi:DNA-binding PadR family transcriptional regulator